MPVFTEKRFNENLNLCRNNVSAVKSIVQDLLVYGCYKAFKDGNTTPLNTVLDMATNSKAIDVRRVTRWVELHAGIARIKEEKFVLNKKVRDESGVTDEASFAQHEQHLRAVAWFDIEGKAKAKSVWDIEDYLGSVIKTLDKHTSDVDAPVDTLRDVAKMLTEVKARIAYENAA